MGKSEYDVFLRASQYFNRKNQRDMMPPMYLHVCVMRYIHSLEILL